MGTEVDGLTSQSRERILDRRAAGLVAARIESDQGRRVGAAARDGEHRPPVADLVLAAGAVGELNPHVGRARRPVDAEIVG